MFNKIFKKEKKITDDKNVLVAALLVHAAKIDEVYTDVEKIIIKKALISLDLATQKDVEDLLLTAEKKEKEANQIVEFTREIKRNPIEFKLKIIEILWKIVYSDGANDNYESNLIRRLCGLLYISDKESGEIKLKVQNTKSRNKILLNSSLFSSNFSLRIFTIMNISNKNPGTSVPKSFELFITPIRNISVNRLKKERI